MDWRPLNMIINHMPRRGIDWKINGTQRGSKSTPRSIDFPVHAPSEHVIVLIRAPMQNNEEQGVLD